jgi:hypothetical protein
VFRKNLGQYRWHDFSFFFVLDDIKFVSTSADELKPLISFLFSGHLKTSSVKHQNQVAANQMAKEIKK